MKLTLKGVLLNTFTISDLKKNVKALRSDSTVLANIDKLFETYEKAKQDKHNYSFKSHI